MANGRPWHLPVIGWLAVIWTGINVLDYLLTQYEVRPFLDLWPAAMADYFLAMPLWLDLLWAVGVWAGFAGAICIVARARAAALLMGIAAVAFLLLTLGLVYLTTPPMERVTGPVGVLIMAGSTAIYALFWVYARAEHRVGDLP
jgi:hypothetical protein